MGQNGINTYENSNYNVKSKKGKVNNMNLTEEQNTRLDFDIQKARAILDCMAIALAGGSENIDVVSLVDAARDYVKDADNIMQEAD